MSQFHEKPFTEISFLDTPDITSEEYRRSYNNLHQLITLDSHQVHTLEDLSAKASLAGGDLKNMIRTHGSPWLQIISCEPPVKAWTYYLYQNQDSSASSSYATIGDGDITIHESHKKRTGPPGPEFLYFPMLIVGIPTGVDLNQFRGPREQGAIYSIEHHLVNRNRLPFENYVPAKYPDNEEHQQGYLKALQRGIRLVLGIVSQPTKLDRVFYF